MKTDAQLQRDVQDELKWEPSVTASEIGVAVNGGTVTLSGTVPTFAEKEAAERAVRRVAGVKAVAEEIQVRPSGMHRRNDTEIAESVARAIQSNVWVPTDVQATVENGWVTLRGEVHWEFQRKAAFNAVRYLAGVKGVTNWIGIKPVVPPEAVKDAIERALKRNAEIDAENINVSTDGGDVILRGHVRSWTEKDEASRAAWNAPGVTAVQNEISVASC